MVSTNSLNSVAQGGQRSSNALHSLPAQVKNPSRNIRQDARQGLDWAAGKIGAPFINRAQPSKNKEAGQSTLTPNGNSNGRSILWKAIAGAAGLTGFIVLARSQGVFLGTGSLPNGSKISDPNEFVGPIDNRFANATALGNLTQDVFPSKNLTEQSFAALPFAIKEECSVEALFSCMNEESSSIEALPFDIKEEQPSGEALPSMTEKSSIVSEMEADVIETEAEGIQTEPENGEVVFQEDSPVTEVVENPGMGFRPEFDIYSQLPPFPLDSKDDIDTDKEVPNSRERIALSPNVRLESPKDELTCPIGSASDAGGAPIHHASENADLDLVKSLVQEGANVNACDQNDWTPLIWATSLNHSDVVKYLIEQGADTGLKSTNGTVPLHWAALNGNVDLMQLFLSSGADGDAVNLCGHSVVSLAVSSGKSDAVKLVLKENPQINVKDQNGYLPLDIVTSKLLWDPRNRDLIEIDSLLRKQGAESSYYSQACSYLISFIQRIYSWF